MLKEIFIRVRITQTSNDFYKELINLKDLNAVNISLAQALQDILLYGFGECYEFFIICLQLFASFVSLCSPCL
ncbi:unnamed protein product [Cuscuta campestris]|uniref:Uncharacterized protein n=1 Tax=Cuscuta campestris TaxID=132261 RepID=A0A484MXN6_9ASTE|nr:unnamed protein product [Cuscuta campestris]